jgi:tetratricopeptide (TPR) repeat protein
MIPRGIGLYRIDDHRGLAHQHAGYDPCVACYIFSAYVLWYLGYPDRATRRIEDGLALAGELSQTFSLSLVMQFATVVHHLRGEVAQAKVCAEANVGMSTEGANVFLLGCGMVEEGWATVHEGRHDAGVARIVQGMDVCRGSGAILEFPHCWAALADAYRVAGRIDEGLQAVADGLTQARATSALFNEAELVRLQGELLLLAASPKPDDAERCFRQAIEIARRRSAKSLELRAATSLARLLQRKGKSEHARRLLTEAYGWFTEGFDTEDLKDAKVLLDELSTG